MVFRSLILIVGLALLGAVVWGLEQLGLTLVVDVLAVLGLYAGIFAVSNWVFMRDYRKEIRLRKEGKLVWRALAARLAGRTGVPNASRRTWIFERRCEGSWGF